MATYLMLSTLTDEGRRTLKDRPERLHEVNREIEAMGARVRDQFALLGPYDFVNVVEAPDNETITRVSAELSSRGTLRLTTRAAVPIGVQHRPLLSFGRGDGRATYVVFGRLTPAGRATLSANPGRLGEIERQVSALGARITMQFRVLGEYDFITFVQAPDNTAAKQIAAEVSGLGTVRLSVHPAVALDRFMALLKIKAYRTEPHSWQTQPWARALRYVTRYWMIDRHAREFCRPLEVEGLEHLRELRGPSLVIANHSSHFDTPVALSVLPGRVRARLAVAAAADRFYRTGRRTWWFSLFWNTFPIQRGGGMQALEYSLDLLRRNWSILIYPEGGRKARPGHVERFHHGVAILAMQAKVPVVPMYMEGLSEIMPRGHRSPRPGPVHVRVGAPVSLEGIEAVPQGTALLERAMRELAGLPARAPAAVAATSPAG